MSEISENGREYIGYEYKELVLDKSQVSFYLDGYESFGWTVDERQPELTESSGRGKTVIRLRRDRKILNKAELTRLQRHFEDCMKQMSALEQSKTATATMVSLIIGILGTAFMAGSVFAVTGETPRILLCILLAIPAFCGWILPYFVYRRIVLQKAQALEPVIEAKRDEIYEVCEKGHRLLL